MTEKLYTNNVHPSSLLQQLSDLWRSNQLCDAVLTVDNVIVAKAHKLVLFAISPKLKSDANYPSNSPFLDVKLPSGIKHRAVHLFLQYLYEGFLLLTTEIAFDMFKIANFLQVTSLLNCCNSFLKSVDAVGITPVDSTKLNKVVCEQNFMRWTTISESNICTKRPHQATQENQFTLKKPKYARDINSIQRTSTSVGSSQTANSSGGARTANKTQRESSGFIFSVNDEQTSYTVEDSDENDDASVRVHDKVSLTPKNKNSPSASLRTGDSNGDVDDNTESHIDNQTPQMQVKKEPTEDPDHPLSEKDLEAIEDGNSVNPEYSSEHARTANETVSSEAVHQRDSPVTVKTDDGFYTVQKIKEEPSDFQKQYGESYGDTWFASNSQNIPLVDDQEEFMAGSSTSADYMQQSFVNQSPGQSGSRRHAMFYSPTAGSTADQSANFDDSSGNLGLDDSVQSQDGAGSEGVLGVNLFFCPVCNRRYTSRKSLQRHKHQHNSEREKHCPVCGKGFFRRYILMDHLKRVHKHETRKTNNAVIESYQASNNQILIKPENCFNTPEYSTI